MKQKKLSQESKVSGKIKEPLSQKKYPLNEPDPIGEDSQDYLQEHHVHQIELEIQVDGLREAKIEIETQLQRYIKLYNELYDHAPVGYCTIARDDGRILKTNLAFAELLGIQRENLVERRFLPVVSEESRSHLSEVWASIFSGSGLSGSGLSGSGLNKHSCDITLLSASQEPLWVRIDATLHEDGQSCEMVITDISDNKKMEKALHQCEIHLSEITQLSGVAEERTLVQALHECEQQKMMLEQEYQRSLSSHQTNNGNSSTSVSTSAPIASPKETDVPKTDYITISSATQGNIMLDARKDVLYLEGADDYTLFVTSAGKEYLTFGTLGKWEQRLFSQGFIRIHRSTIVNFHAIYSWHYENKNIVLNMRDGKQIRVSKSYKAYFLSYVR